MGGREASSIILSMANGQVERKCVIGQVALWNLRKHSVEVLGLCLLCPGVAVEDTLFPGSPNCVMLLEGKEKELWTASLIAG